jgi:hypothetical protein
MNKSKQELISELRANHQEFAIYLSGLSDDEFNFCYLDKWSASQQLEHITLCVKPLVKVFSMDKAVIAQMFGRTDRVGRSTDELLAEYLARFAEGGKAPARFVPESVPDNPRLIRCIDLTDLVDTMCAGIDTFSEDELDQLLVPHPLLDMLTLREMIYNAVYHVTHHQANAIANLAHF